MQVIPGLLKYWPFGNSQKQIMFINELEDIFEYVQVRPGCLPDARDAADRGIATRASMHKADMEHLLVISNAPPDAGRRYGGCAAAAGTATK